MPTHAQIRMMTPAPPPQTSSSRQPATICRSIRAVVKLAVCCGQIHFLIDGDLGRGRGRGERLCDCLSGPRHGDGTSNVRIVLNVCRRGRNALPGWSVWRCLWYGIWERTDRDGRFRSACKRCVAHFPSWNEAAVGDKKKWHGRFNYRTKHNCIRFSGVACAVRILVRACRYRSVPITQGTHNSLIPNSKKQLENKMWFNYSTTDPIPNKNIEIQEIFISTSAYTNAQVRYTHVLYVCVHSTCGKTTSKRQYPGRTILYRLWSTFLKVHL